VVFSTVCQSIIQLLGMCLRRQRKKNHDMRSMKEKTNKQKIMFEHKWLCLRWRNTRKSVWERNFVVATICFRKLI